MATAMRNPDTSAVSTERFRTWRTSMSGSEILSSWATHRPSMTRQKATSPSERSDVHPQLSSLAEHHGDADHCGAEGDHPEVVKPSGTAIRSGWQHHDDQDECHGDRDRTEPEGRPEAEELGDQRGDRVAQSGADRRAHRERGDGAACLLGGELAAGHRHGHRQQAEAEPLQASPDDQDREAGRDGREDASHQDRPEGHLDDSALVRAVGQAAHGGGGQGACHQCGRQHPFGGTQRDVVRLGDRGDEGCAQAGDHRHKSGDTHQDRQGGALGPASNAGLSSRDRPHRRHLLGRALTLLSPCALTHCHRLVTSSGDSIPRSARAPTGRTIGEPRSG